MKIVKKIIILLLTFFIITNVYAADYSYRSNKENRVTVDIDNQKLYVSASVLFNVTGDYAGTYEPISNFTAEFKENTLYVSIKRSELNKIFREKTYDNVYSLFEITADFLDLKTNKKYFYLTQNDANSLPNEGYTATFGENDYLIKNYNFIEVFNSPIRLIGTFSKAESGYQGGMQIYEVDSYPDNVEQYPKNYKLEDLNLGYNPIIKLDKRNTVITIVEDEQIDLGNNNIIIGSEKKTNEDGTQSNEIVNINNFYAEYFDNNKLQYSWTTFDLDGNPVELNLNTEILIDESENENKIISLFGSEFNDIKDRLKFISFSHEGNIGGKARVSLYVGDKFEPGSIVTVFYYNPETELLENPNFDDNDAEEKPKYSVLVDNDGYISIELTHCSEYVITDNIVANTANLNKDVTNNDIKTKTNNIIFKLIIIIVLLVIIGIVVYFILKKKKQSKDNN